MPAVFHPGSGPRWLALCAVLMLAVLAVNSGCRRSGGDSMIAAANRTNLDRLCNLYNYYQAKNGWVGPPDEQAFRSFIAGLSPRVLERMGGSTADVPGLFVSERDQQPFRIRYRVPGNSRGSDEPVVFETTGVDGKRMVGFTSSRHREVESAEYDALWGNR